MESSFTSVDLWLLFERGWVLEVDATCTNWIEAYKQLPRHGDLGISIMCFSCVTGHFELIFSTFDVRLIELVCMISIAIDQGCLLICISLRCHIPASVCLFIFLSPCKQVSYEMYRF